MIPFALRCKSIRICFSDLTLGQQAGRICDPLFILLSKGKGSLRRASPGHRPHKHLQPNHCMSIVYPLKTVKQYSNKKTAADFIGCCKKLTNLIFILFQHFFSEIFITHDAHGIILTTLSLEELKELRKMIQFFFSSFYAFL